MGIEIERKYLNVDMAALRRRLAACGARCLGAHFESNLLFDRHAALRKAGRLLRLRSQERPDGTRHVLTLKLPAAPSLAYKKREEREMALADPAALRAILEGLGYAVYARYEKVRESWRLDDVEAALDTLPFGQVVELEGPERAIDDAQRRLCLDNAPQSVKSYHELHQEWLARHHLPPALSFAFSAAERDAWRRKLRLPPDG